MKTKRVLILLIPLLLASCNRPAGDAYETKTINVYYPKSQNNTTCNVRYYNGSVIPYVSLKDYVKLLYRGRTYPEGRDRFDVSQNNKVYTITVAGDYTATFDVGANKMESADLWNFKNTNLTGYGELVSVCYDGLPFTKVVKAEFDKAPKATTIDFSKYNLKIYGDEEAIYVPLAFASDLFTNENILQGTYNNKDIYIFNFTENESLGSYTKKYYDDIFTTPISKEYSEYTYNEMCLSYDYFLGRPGRSSLEIYYDLSKGLDTALKARPLGRTIVEYMTSGDLTRFLAGSTLLGYLHEDGGHSGYSPLFTAYADPTTGAYKQPTWLDNKTYLASIALLRDEFNKNYDELINSDEAFRDRESLYEARNVKLNKTNDVLSGTETYTKDGDIAYIHIDGFMGEINLQDEWNKYYKGERDTIPFGDGVGGAVGAITYGVRQAASDKEIKHLVIDLAANSGGSTDEMLFMIGLLTGSEKFYEKNIMSGCYCTATFDFDYNFDRVFDEKDDEVRKQLEGLDISILTTKNGFSCGGISPVYLHDEGLFTIGEECGGGSCSVYMQYDAFGFLNRSSSPNQTVSKNKVSIDIARKTVCDSVMNFPYDEEEEVHDYTSLYDTATLRRLITEHYTK